MTSAVTPDTVTDAVPWDADWVVKALVSFPEFVLYETLLYVIVIWSICVAVFVTSQIIATSVPEVVATVTACTETESWTAVAVRVEYSYVTVQVMVLSEVKYDPDITRVPVYSLLLELQEAAVVV